MDLLLHIGAEKTGTTSLQSWLGKNRAALRDKGVFFPASLGETRSIRMSMITAHYENAGAASLAGHGITSAQALRDFAVGVERDFTAELRQAEADGCRVCLISDEGLQGFLRTGEEVARVRDFAARFFSTVRVVLCLRAQVDYAVSHASTAARRGQRIDRAWFDRVTPDNARYGYDRLVAKWEQAFGADNVQLLSYRREPDSIGTFGRLLGVDRAGFAEVARENGFLDWRYIQILNGLSAGRSERLPRLMARLPQEQPLRIGRALAETINARFLADNAALVARRPDITQGDLVPDAERHGTNGNIDRLEEDLFAPGMLDALLEPLVSAMPREGAAGRTQRLLQKGMKAAMVGRG